jgi:hypothetical protein
VAVEVVTQATDHGQIEPMREQIEQRYGASPGAMLVDGGFVFAHGHRCGGGPGLSGLRAQCVNAIARNRGLEKLRVRGRDKVKAILNF